VVFFNDNSIGGGGFPFGVFCEVIHLLSFLCFRSFFASSQQALGFHDGLGIDGLWLSLFLTFDSDLR
jgi:hypothetical protein